MPSLKIPKIVDTAVSTLKELLAFSALPYYQASGILKSAEGEVKIGDPIAWEVATKKFIKFDPGATQVTDEAVGTGDSSTRAWYLAHGYVQRGSYTIKVDGAAKVEGDDYAIDLNTGLIVFVAAPGVVDITATYKYYANLESDKAKAVGFVRIPGDSTDADVFIEAVIGGAVKKDLVEAATSYDIKVYDDLKAVGHLNGNAIIF